MLGYLMRAFLLDRLLRRTMGHGRRRSPYGYGRRSRGRTGFAGPFPYYSRRTRGGSRVAVSGCCLPIPLGILAALLAGARAFSRR